MTSRLPRGLISRLTSRLRRRLPCRLPSRLPSRLHSRLPCGCTTFRPSGFRARTRLKYFATNAISTSRIWTVFPLWAVRTGCVSCACIVLAGNTILTCITCLCVYIRIHESSGNTLCTNIIISWNLVFTCNTCITGNCSTISYTTPIAHITNARVLGSCARSITGAIRRVASPASCTSAGVAV